jgi:hypothetical protein
LGSGSEVADQTVREAESAISQIAGVAA